MYKIRKIDWILKDMIKINPTINTDKIGPYLILNKKYIYIKNRNEIRIKYCYENIVIFIIKYYSKHYANKIEEYYHKSIINRYKYSGISEKKIE